MEFKFNAWGKIIFWLMDFLHLLSPVSSINIQPNLSMKSLALCCRDPKSRQRQRCLGIMSLYKLHVFFTVNSAAAPATGWSYVWWSHKKICFITIVKWWCHQPLSMRVPRLGLVVVHDKRWHCCTEWLVNFMKMAVYLVNFMEKFI